MTMLTDWLAQRGIKPTPCMSDLPTGWESLVDRLVTDLTALGWDRDLYQVKEKFGGLRFYVGAHDYAMRDRIASAEEESYRTCQDCGTTTDVTTDRIGLHITLCPRCRANWLNSK